MSDPAIETIAIAFKNSLDIHAYAIESKSTTLTVVTLKTHEMYIPSADQMHDRSA
jgi:hypothetical protein